MYWLSWDERVFRAGGRHSPYTAVCVVYQLCGRMREHAYPTYHKEGWSNFLGTGSSKMLATAVIVIWEV